MDDVLSPHDKFLKLTLGGPDASREFFLHHLPPGVVEQIDLGTLQPANGSFVDGELRESCSDLLFTARLVGGDEALVYLLIEHKSYPDRLTAFQLLRYVVRVLERRLREDQPLCVVIPLVLYHGPRAWTVARSMDELIDAPESLRRYVPSMATELIDLSQFDDDELLRENALLHVAMRLLKYVLTPELRDKLPGIARLLSKVIEEPDGGECVMAVFRYLGSAVAAEKITPEELLRVVQSHISPKGNKIMPTIAEVWIQQGIERGKLLGAIHLLEELLGKQLSDIETLKQMTLEQLAERVQALRDEQAG